MSDNFRPHEVTWTREQSARFWDVASGLPGYNELYFSRRVGHSIVRFVQKKGVRLSGRVLDFGCGPGFFLEDLLNLGASCEGVEFSESSAQKASERLAGYGGFNGVTVAKDLPTPLPSESFDLVFLIETVEHLLEADLGPTLDELFRLARRSGVVVVTTPNEERMEKAQTLCPNCGCIFHRMQHVRKWDARLLSSTMSDSGFQEVLSNAVFFAQKNWQSRLLAVAMQVLRQKLPHLIYIGKRP